MNKLIALLAILAIVLVGCGETNITGGAVGIDTVIEETAEECTDSDQGINKETKGVVKIDDQEYEDQCIAGLLIEYYCKDNKKENQNFNCKNECSNGKCV